MPDIVVAGLGAAGSAALAALARRGASVLGLDRHNPPHALGSTHGRSRIIREAYYESPVYVPLVRRAWQLWEELELAAGRPLLRRTGGLNLGPPDGELVSGARQSARTYGLPHAVLAADEIRRRFPVFAVADDTVGVLEERAGFLDPEACIAELLVAAQRDGAGILRETGLRGWRVTGGGVELQTDHGVLGCKILILALGPWLPQFRPGAIPLEVERQVMYWFEPRAGGERFAAGRLPVFLWEWEAGRFFYGIPDHGHGLKLARHHEGARTTPETVDRTVPAAEVETMRALARRFLPDADGALRETAVCLYTNTPDSHFVLGPHLEAPGVLLASPCSGHGFKFAPAVGEILADLALTGTTAADISPFRPDRFRPS